MIIFINGSINSGKSTISKLLQEKLGNTALIEVDSLRECIEWMPLEQAIPINLKSAVSLIHTFASEGLHVIVSYPLSEKDRDYLLENIRAGRADIFVITLAPQLEVALSNRGNRELTDWEKERIRYHYTIGINTPPFGKVIDNSDQSPLETVSEILQLIGVD